jgi:hypothetical protein
MVILGQQFTAGVIFLQDLVLGMGVNAAAWGFGFIGTLEGGLAYRLKIGQIHDGSRAWFAMLTFACSI